MNPMNPQIPLDDPSANPSLSQRTALYIRASVLLQGVLVLTACNHVAVLVLLVLGITSPSMAGFLVLLSLLTWFFAVVLPVINRAVRAHAGVGQTELGDLVERFGRLVLFAQTGFYTYLLVQIATTSPGA